MSSYVYIYDFLSNRHLFKNLHRYFWWKLRITLYYWAMVNRDSHYFLGVSIYPHFVLSILTYFIPSLLLSCFIYFFLFLLRHFGWGNGGGRGSPLLFTKTVFSYLLTEMLRSDGFVVEWMWLDSSSTLKKVFLYFSKYIPNWNRIYKQAC